MATITSKLFTKALEQYNESRDVDAFQEVVNKVADEARAGDIASQKILLAYTIPAIKAEQATAPMDAAAAQGDAVTRANNVLKQMHAGSISLEQGRALIDGYKILFDTQQMEELRRELAKLRGGVSLPGFLS